ncbi:uncharacterized protein LOC104908574 isoform X2 [Beta vulgaris subsp. vulgaris]|uniref:uncharacterized protein LOC104908574 isoform X2 n=1 Tax=Beta vulgaris subsp. vulgaris TaxID=3555 RepID=UPI000901C0C3|nr:uncharacterized protein LOC104908574 isoform X2 [Beta vulgaris subsp. vulgaris]
MQDAEKMKEAGAKSRIECYNSRALYDSMLKILERFLQEKIEEKRVKILDTEVENRLEIMKKLLVQNTGIDNLEIQETDCKDLKFINRNEVHNQIHSDIQQKTGREAISVLHLPTEGESCEQSEDKNGVSTSVADDFVRILSQAYKDDLDLHSIPSMTFKNTVAARLALLDEIKKEKSADEETMAEKMKQGNSDIFDVKMDNSSSSKIALEKLSSFGCFQGSTKIILKLTQASQPLEDHDNLLSQCTQVDFRKLKPEWLERFFKRTFFEPCSEHPIRRNELNKYCIDCDASLCQYCVSLASHANHRLLKIYRHVYKDVVPLDEIERHIDCSLIQPYRCNRQLVIALTPLPHSGTKTIEEATCQTCKRKLIEYDVYSYCSISCKVEAFMKKQNDFAPPFLLLDQVEENPEQESAATKTRKRKGIPHRSPFS